MGKKTEAEITELKMNDEHLIESAKVDIKRMSKLADSTLDSSIILLDFRKQKDALHCLTRALEYKMLALIRIKTKDLPKRENILRVFEDYFKGSKLTEKLIINTLKHIFRHAPDQNWPIDDLASRTILDHKTVRIVSLFFRRCNLTIRDAMKGKMDPCISEKCLGGEKDLPGQMVDKSKTYRFVKKRKLQLSVFLLLGVVIAASFAGIFGSVLISDPNGHFAKNSNKLIYLSGKENGLVGTYFGTTKLLDRGKIPKVSLQRLDSIIDFNWTNLSADPCLPSTHYSVRWTGHLRIARNGDYEFFTVSDDGTRLWIDDELLIDDWNLHGVEERSAKKQLTKGWHKICLDYLQLGGDAVIKLLWRQPDSEKVLIPSESLRPKLNRTIKKSGH